MQRESDSPSICIFEYTGDFAEDKDIAAEIRDKQIRKLISDGKQISIDFSEISLATQSFVHALISDILRSHGEESLDLIEFRGCNSGVRGIIETVVQYSLETAEEDDE